MTLRVQRALVLAATLGCVPSVGAHDSPEHEIERLSHLMARAGKTSRLLFERATEYRAWGRMDLAEEDLSEAIRLDPEFTAARLDLSRLYLAAGQLTNALETAGLALEHAPEPAQRGPLHMVRAQIHLARGDYGRALDECDLAFAQGPAGLDWYLTRSRLQFYLQRHEARLQGLRTGLELTGSFVLEIEWMEALLDAGRYEEAWRAIEPQFQQVRWQSSWLSRRARARLGLGGQQEARQDLQSALEEIDGRLDAERPDLTLLADRGMAWALLGDQDQARRALEELKRRNADQGLVWRLEWMVKAGLGLAVPQGRGICG